jgi:hypothetical protein
MTQRRAATQLWPIHSPIATAPAYTARHPHGHQESAADERRRRLRRRVLRRLRRPVLRHDSNTAVAFQSGGDPLCRAQAHPLRLDIPAARAFYSDYLQVP